MDFHLLFLVANDEYNYELENEVLKQKCEKIQNCKIIQDIICVLK